MLKALTSQELDRFHLAQDVIDRLPQIQSIGAHAQQLLRDKPIEHRHYIIKHGEDMPEILNWQWSNPK
ncbi:hypothetical protein [Chamaesiphon minutus]|uniref:phosphoketolase family protein n=1 Tax=Chamaesiphon minutus TaxID=1173032 RepID=UPI000315F04E